MDPYQPAQWHDFFITVGGGAAALTGLVVVAMSLHVRAIAADPALRHRARSILTGLAAAFMRSSLVLMGGQNGIAVGTELLIASTVLTVTGVLSFRQVSRSSTPAPRATVLRTLGGTACY